jgi:acyl carrier protein
MNVMETLQEVNTIFREVLDDDTIVLSPETSAADVEGWDSLNHIYMVVELEKHFRIKFSTEEVHTWQNVGEICRAIESKVKQKAG